LQHPAPSTSARQQLRLHREGETTLRCHPGQALTPSPPFRGAGPCQRRALPSSSPTPRPRTGRPLTAAEAQRLRGAAPQARRMRGPAARAGEFKPASRPCAWSG